MIQIPIIFEESTTGLQSFNCFVTENEGKLVLIDGGIPHERFVQFAEQTLQQHGYDFSDLEAIYLTHHHEDHVGLLPSILAKKPLPVYVHAEAVPRLLFDEDFLTMRIAFYEAFYARMDCADDAKSRLDKQRATLSKAKERRIEADYRIIDAHDKVGRFDIIDLRGHSTDSIGYYDAVTRELYAGDTILKHTSTNAIIDPLVTGEYVQANLLQRQALEKIKALPIEQLYAGHQPIFSDVADVATQKITRLNDKADHLLTLLKTPMTAREATQAFYSKLYDRQFSLVISEIVGQLDYLQQQQLITARLQDGVYLFEQNKG